MTKPVRIAHVATVDLTLRFLLMDQMRRLRHEGFEVTGISAPGPWVPDLEREGIRHVSWPHVTRAWAPGADLRALVELVGILRRGRFDLVHTHNPKPGVLGRVAARLAGIPCVVNTVHGLYATPEDRLVKRVPVLAMEWFAARFSDAELYQSKEDLAWARRAGLVGAEKAVLLGNGTDLARFAPSSVDTERSDELRVSLGIPEGSLVVGTVGRLVAEKGFREVFAAMRSVRSVDPSARLLVVGGSDPEKSDSLSEREIAGAREGAIFAGWREDVRDLLGLMDVFVLASWREGMPRSAIEAAAMGKPLVLTDIRGCREVVTDGVEGILVRTRDHRQLAEAIGRLARDRSLRERMGLAARAKAEERFDERRVGDTVVGCYRRLLSQRGRLGEANGEVRLRMARPADASALARLHRDALPDAFLPTLGTPLLRTLYRALTRDAEAVAFVAEDGSGLVGLASGVLSVGGFYRRFAIRHGTFAVLRALPKLLRPATVRRIRETATYPSRVGSLPQAELLSIAVDEGSRSRGVGRLLAERVVDGLAERGAGEIKVVVGAENEGANRFYERLGFRHAARIAVHDASASNVWTIARDRRTVSRVPDVLSPPASS